jgi:hypothetical protein
MVLAISVIVIIIAVLAEADGMDWEQEQRNADRRTRAIIGAIHSSTSEITSCYSRIAGEQIDYYKRFSEDMKNEREFKDEHGRWFRERMVYDSEGRVIAKEVIGIER